jgi:hypothetical protein
MMAEDYEIAQRMFDTAIMLSPRHYATAQANLVELDRRREQVLVSNENSSAWTASSSPSRVLMRPHSIQFRNED